MRKRAVTRQCGQGDEVCSRGPQEGSAPGSGPELQCWCREKLFRESAHLTDVLECVFF